jgi:beta-lactamase class D
MPKWDKIFEKYDAEGCFYMIDPDKERIFFSNPIRCKEEFVPASTIKILFSLIGLEEGKISSIDEDTLIWKEELHSSKNRGEKLTLRDAYKTSSNWYFQEICRQVGADTVEKYIQSIDCYGNMTHKGELENFWLDGSFVISAEEQVEFLRRLVSYELPFSENVIDSVLDLMIETETKDFTLRAKTGTSFEKNSNENIAWYVGMAKKHKRNVIFAMNMKLPADTLTEERLWVRKDITREILDKQGFTVHNIKTK